MELRTWLFAALLGFTVGKGREVHAAPKQAKPQAPTWRWTGALPTHLLPAAEVSHGDQRCRFSRDDISNIATLACFNKAGSKIWSHETVAAHFDRAALAINNDALFVVRFSDGGSGATVTSFNRTAGSVNWHRQVIGVGPMAHSDYVTNVEVAIVGDVLRVYGWESYGRYIEDLDLRSGAALANGTVDDHDNFRPRALPQPAQADGKPPQPGAAKGVAFKFRGDSPRWNKTVTAQSNGTNCVETLAQHGDTAVLTCTTTPANKTARKPTTSKSWSLQQARFVPGGALAINDRLVVVATFCAISTGATIDAYARESGELLWHADLYGIGPVGHSKYFNDVDLRFEGHRVVVSGAEAFGNYVEVIDATTGNVIGNRSEGKIEAE